MSLRQGLVLGTAASELLQTLLDLQGFPVATLTEGIQEAKLVYC